MTGHSTVNTTVDNGLHSITRPENKTNVLSKAGLESND